MSKNLSLKLQDEIFEETEHVLRKVKRPRNAYINEAIHFYNKPFFNKDALFKKNISLKKKCPSPKPSITIEPYRIPLPVMIASEKSIGKKW